jgi:hypothetical protein
MPKPLWKYVEEEIKLLYVRIFEWLCYARLESKLIDHASQESLEGMSPTLRH